MNRTPLGRTAIVATAALTAFLLALAPVNVGTGPDGSIAVSGPQALADDDGDDWDDREDDGDLDDRDDDDRDDRDDDDRDERDDDRDDDDDD